MKRLLIATAALATVTSAALAADVGVSINIGQPGFYGQIDIGDFPHPQVIYSQPKIIDHVPNNRPPIYLHVPPGYTKHWRTHCHEYNACGERVFFVQDKWYNHEYVPHYQEKHPDHRFENRNDSHRGEANVRHDGDNKRGDDRDDRRSDDHGHGN